ncbi:MAG TPA: iron-containing alcohol dehydrogenase, partial [Verrucomicrobiae bacterium]|nr:iron-containing alcohol dehydrogenase [Verrucomicrobiae bacterium]
MTAAPVLHGDWLFPTEIRFGVGRVAELGDVCRRLGLRRPLIVTDRGLAATPIAGLVRDAASTVDVSPGFFAEVQENPTGRNVEAGVAAFNDHRADGIIALGGGSGLDCAKTIAILAAFGGP